MRCEIVLSTSHSLMNTEQPFSSTSQPVDTALPRSRGPKTRFRWVICTLLLLATTVNYMDRQILGILATTLQQDIGWTELEYSRIVQAFTLAYAVGLLLAGRIIDRVGVKMGYAVSIVWWSVAAMAHALARTPLGFGLARFTLGFGEAGNFPAAIKAVAEWFPKQERALATGIFNGGANLGSILAPIVVPWLALTFGWQQAFIWVGAVGFLWLVAWWMFYETPERSSRLGAEELSYISQDQEGQESSATQATSRSWSVLEVLQTKQAWAFIVGKFMTDGVWWFYAYWLPKFFETAHGIKLDKIALPLVVVYAVAGVGSVAGGWLSGQLIASGMSAGKGRKGAMVVCGLCVLPTIMLPQMSSVVVVVGLVSLAAAAHQGWSANLFTTASDMFPKQAVATVVGIGGMSGAVGGVVLQEVIGRVLQANAGNYTPIFVICSAAYLSALALMHLLVPRFEPVGRA
jgi:ACS family hexuronate transporter-like MFS transporter